MLKTGKTMLDTEGVELHNIESAREQAVIETGTMLSDHAAEFWKDRLAHVGHG